MYIIQLLHMSPHKKFVKFNTTGTWWISSNLESKVDTAIIFFRKIRGIYGYAAFAPTTGICDGPSRVFDHKLVIEPSRIGIPDS